MHHPPPCITPWHAVFNPEPQAPPPSPPPTASAAFHKSPRVMLAVMKFFLGQDKDDEGSDKDDGSEDEGHTKAYAPSKEDVYRASHKVGQGKT